MYGPWLQADTNRNQPDTLPRLVGGPADIWLLSEDELRKLCEQEERTSADAVLSNWDPPIGISSRGKSKEYFQESQEAGGRDIFLGKKDGQGHLIVDGRRSNQHSALHRHRDCFGCFVMVLLTLVRR